MKSFRTTFRDPQGAGYHIAAIAYAVLGYAIGITLLFQQSLLWNATGTLLLAHGMTIAAYMVHEFAHSTVFRSKAANDRLAGLLTWICGACYGTVEDIRYKHLRHHVDVDDLVWFDYARYFQRHPVVLRVIEKLEWFYVPAHDLLMHAIMAIGSFVIPERRSQRARNLAVLLVRGGIFVGVLLLAPKAALLYAVAYGIMMTILRFMDSLQHDYDFNPTLFEKDLAPRRGDRVFEQEHTFSNPHSFQHAWLNAFTLNFGFHNAHHARAQTPWYRLPALHRELFGDDPAKVIPLGPQLRIFHRYRVTRIAGSGGPRDPADSPWGHAFLLAAREGRAVGGNAASFLTSF